MLICWEETVYAKLSQNGWRTSSWVFWFGIWSEMVKIINTFWSIVFTFWLRNWMLVFQKSFRVLSFLIIVTVFWFGIWSEMVTIITLFWLLSSHFGWEIECWYSKNPLKFGHFWLLSPYFGWWFDQKRWK